MHSMATGSPHPDFDFDCWIEQNRLTEIKHIFIDHNMCCPSNLSMQYTKFPQFIASISMSRPVFVSKVVETLQKLEHQKGVVKFCKTAISQTTTDSKDTVHSLRSTVKSTLPQPVPMPIPNVIAMNRKITATEEEFNVEETITSRLEALSSMRQRVESLHAKCTLKMEMHREQSQNVDAVEQDISTKFECISSQTKQHQMRLLEELELYKTQCSASGEALQSALSALAAVQQRMDSERQHQENQLLRVKQLLENHELDRRARKSQVLGIGEDVQNRFDRNQATFQELIRSHPDLVTAHNDAESAGDLNQNSNASDLAEPGNCGNGLNAPDDFMIELNVHSFTKIMRHLPKFGRLKYRAFDPLHRSKGVQEPQNEPHELVHDVVAQIVSEIKLEDEAASSFIAMNAVNVHPAPPPIQNTNDSNHLDVANSPNTMTNEHDDGERPDIHSMSTHCHSMGSQPEEYRKQIDLLKECMATKMKRIDQMEDVLAAKEKVILSLRRELAEMEASSPSLCPQLFTLKQSNQEKEEMLESQRRFIEKLTAKHNETERTLRAEIEHKMAEIQRLSDRLHAVHREANSKIASASQQSVRLNTLEETVHSQSATMEKMKRIIRSFGSKIQDDEAQIESLRRRLVEAERDENDAIHSKPSRSAAESEAWEELQKWSAQNDSLREQVESQRVVFEGERSKLQKQIEALNEMLSTKMADKEKEIKAVRMEMKQQRTEFERERAEKEKKIAAMESKKDLELAMEYRKTKADKKKKGKKEKVEVEKQKKEILKAPASPPQSVTDSTVSGNTYVVGGMNREQKSRQKTHQQILKKLNVKFKKFNGREYVEDYCRVGGYSEPKVVTEYIGKNGKSRIARKAKETLWMCTIEIPDAHLKHVEHSKVRKSASDSCYHNFAARISRGQIF